MDRTKQEIQSDVRRYEILHNYLLQKNKVGFKYKNIIYKELKTYTLIMFTNKFKYSPIQTLYQTFTM